MVKLHILKKKITPTTWAFGYNLTSKHTFFSNGLVVETTNQLVFFTLKKHRSLHICRHWMKVNHHWMKVNHHWMKVNHLKFAPENRHPIPQGNEKVFQPSIDAMEKFQGGVILFFINIRLPGLSWPFSLEIHPCGANKNSLMCETTKSETFCVDGLA